MLSSFEAKVNSLPVGGLERMMTHDAYRAPRQLEWLDKQLQPVLAVGRVWLGFGDAEGMLKDARAQRKVDRAPDAGGEPLTERLYRLPNGDMYRMPMQDIERERYEFLLRQQQEAQKAYEAEAKRRGLLGPIGGLVGNLFGTGR